MSYPMKPVTAESIYYKLYKPSPMIVEDLIPKGLTVLGGTSKIGKSWMALDLAISVAAGAPFLGKPTTKTGVLYFCLEDTGLRIRNRMHKLTDESPPGLYLSGSSERLGSGFVRDIISFLREHPDVEIIIIDTLQKIRGSDDGTGTYAKDYEEIAKLKEIADLNGKAIVVIHHLRKLQDKHDPYNEIAGSTAITGASDTNMVLKKPEGSCTAVLYVRGRDIEERKLILEFRFPRWNVLEELGAYELEKEQIPPALFKIADFIRERGPWSGSATQLLDQIDDHSVAPNKLMQQMTRHYYDVLFPAGIDLDHRKENKVRRIILSYYPEKDRGRTSTPEGSDDSDDSDGPPPTP